MSLVIPEKYKDKFTEGGVLLQINGQVEVDYIEIQPMH